MAYMSMEKIIVTKGKTVYIHTDASLEVFQQAIANGDVLAQWLLNNNNEPTTKTESIFYNGRVYASEESYKLVQSNATVIEDNNLRDVYNQQNGIQWIFHKCLLP